MSTHFAQPSPAPGRDAPAPQTTAQTSAPDQSQPPAGGSSAPGGQTWMMLVMFVPILLILFMSRNQTKKQKALEASLKVGDDVVTQSGLLGRIAEMDERIVKLEIAPGVKVKVLKSTVQAQTPIPDAKADGKDEAKDKPQEKKA